MDRTKEKWQKYLYRIRLDLIDNENVENGSEILAVPAAGFDNFLVRAWLC